MLRRDPNAYLPAMTHMGTQWVVEKNSVYRAKIPWPRWIVINVLNRASSAIKVPRKDACYLAGFSYDRKAGETVASIDVQSDIEVKLVNVSASIRNDRERWTIFSPKPLLPVAFAGSNCLARDAFLS